MREWSRTSKGLYIPGVQVFQTMALPSSWEAVTMSQEWRFDMVVPLTHGEDESGTGMVLAGKVYVVAEWEPVAAAGDMSDDELRLLFSACRLNVDQAISSFSTPE
jgi:hypothetical protein